MLRKVDNLGKICIPIEWRRKIVSEVNGETLVQLAYDVEENIVTMSSPVEIFKCSM